MTEWKATGFDAIRDRFQSALERERVAIDKIANTCPTTIEGVFALIAFTRTVVCQDELHGSDLPDRLFETTLRALSELTGRPIPKVTPWLYSFDDDGKII